MKKRIWNQLKKAVDKIDAKLKRYVLEEKENEKE